MTELETADTPTVIAIDGPAGSGKSTVGRRLAARLGLEYLDTGAMYRAVTFAMIRHRVDPDDADAVTAVAVDAVLELRDGSVFVDGLDVTEAIRTPEITREVSRVASHPGVRTELVNRQRAWARTRGGAVLEGRDIGTVVFPDALLKVYLTASPGVRAARRAAEMGIDDPTAIAAIESDIARRDEADSNREASPLSRAEDAIEFLTDDLEVDEVVDQLAALVEERRP